MKDNYVGSLLENKCGSPILIFGNNGPYTMRVKREFINLGDASYVRKKEFYTGKSIFDSFVSSKKDWYSPKIMVLPLDLPWEEPKISGRKYGAPLETLFWYRANWDFLNSINVEDTFFIMNHERYWSDKRYASQMLFLRNKGKLIDPRSVEDILVAKKDIINEFLSFRDQI